MRVVTPRMLAALTPCGYSTPAIRLASVASTSDWSAMRRHLSSGSLGDVQAPAQFGQFDGGDDAGAAEVVGDAVAGFQRQSGDWRQQHRTRAKSGGGGQGGLEPAAAAAVQPAGGATGAHAGAHAR